MAGWYEYEGGGPGNDDVTVVEDAGTRHDGSVHEVAESEHETRLTDGDGLHQDGLVLENTEADDLVHEETGPGCDGLVHEIEDAVHDCFAGSRPVYSKLQIPATSY